MVKNDAILTENLLGRRQTRRSGEPDVDGDPELGNEPEGPQPHVLVPDVAEGDLIDLQCFERFTFSA